MRKTYRFGQKARHESWLDHTYFYWYHRKTPQRIFSYGLGDRAYLDRVPWILRNLDQHKQLDANLEQIQSKRDRKVYKGRFLSPCHADLPNICKWGVFHLVMPKNWTKDTPVFIQFAATGDDGFQRRTLGFSPMLKQGIGSLILENPYYGERTPHGQVETHLNFYSDFWKMCLTAIQEGHALLYWLKQEGFSKLGIAGVSMGGTVTGILGSIFREFPIAITACIPSHSPAPVFTEGLLSYSVDWEVLSHELDSDPVPYIRKSMQQSDIRIWDAPEWTKSTRLLLGKNDAYIPSYSSEIFESHWHNVKTDWIPAGHVGTVFLKSHIYRKAVAEAFRQLDAY